jgi:hypothetical protein
VVPNYRLDPVTSGVGQMNQADALFSKDIEQRVPAGTALKLNITD